MKRFLFVIAALLGLWVLASFTGAMLSDMSRTEFWVQSLLWSMLSMAVMAPVIGMLIRFYSIPSPVSVSRPSAVAPLVEPDAVDALSAATEDSEPEQSAWPYLPSNTDAVPKR